MGLVLGTIFISSEEPQSSVIPGAEEGIGDN